MNSSVTFLRTVVRLPRHRKRPSMGKCSPAAAKILSTFERAEAGNDVAGSDFAEFFLMVVERRLPPNLAALFREFSI